MCWRLLVDYVPSRLAYARVCDDLLVCDGGIVLALEHIDEHLWKGLQRSLRVVCFFVVRLKV